jgi:hypothetical protein
LIVIVAAVLALFATPAVTEILPVTVVSPLNVRGIDVPAVVIVKASPALMAFAADAVLLPKVVPVNILVLIDPFGADNSGTRGAWM